MAEKQACSRHRICNFRHFRGTSLVTMPISFILSLLSLMLSFFMGCSAIERPPEEEIPRVQLPNRQAVNNSTNDSTQTGLIEIPSPSTNPVENVFFIQKAFNDALDSPQQNIRIVFPQAQSFQVLEEDYQKIINLNPVARHEAYCNMSGNVIPLLEIDLDRNQIQSKKISIEGNESRIVYAGNPEYCDVAKRRPILFLKSAKELSQRNLDEIKIANLHFEWEYTPFLQGLIKEVGPQLTDDMDSYVDIELASALTTDGLYAGKKIARFKTYLNSSQSLAPNALILQGKASNASREPSELSILALGVNGDPRRIRIRLPKRSLWESNNPRADCYPESQDEPEYSGTLNCDKPRLGLAADGNMGLLVDQMIFERPSISAFGFTTLRLDHVSIHHSGSTGLNLNDGRNIFIDGLKISPKENSGLLLSSVADGINFGEIAGQIEIRNS